MKWLLYITLMMGFNCIHISLQWIAIWLAIHWLTCTTWLLFASLLSAFFSLLSHLALPSLLLMQTLRPVNVSLSLSFFFSFFFILSSSLALLFDWMQVHCHFIQAHTQWQEWSSWISNCKAQLATWIVIGWLIVCPLWWRKCTMCTQRNSIRCQLIRSPLFYWSCMCIFLFSTLTSPCYSPALSYCRRPISLSSPLSLSTSSSRII